MHAKTIFICFLCIEVTATAMAKMDEFIKPCADDIIFCDQDVLKKVQLTGIYKDSKTFVDMPVKLHVENISEVRNAILSANTKSEIANTVLKYFDDAGYREISAGNLTDMKESYKFLKNIRSIEYKEWAKKLCSKWQNLARKINESVLENKDHFSLIYLNETMVVPGGRFREIYYWDTYWVIDGLCLCELYGTAKGVLKNLIYFVKDFGFVPNGGRKYYLNRSQPPMLTLMMDLYLQYTNDSKFIKENIDILYQEYEFWIKHRHINVTVSDKTYELARYNSMMGYPRPESYKEDVETIKEAGFENDQAKAMQLYSHIASAAESGWDFSSRWFADRKSLKTIHTRDIVPVDLNCILYKVELILSKFYGELYNNVDKAKELEHAANKRFESLNELLWNKDTGMWQDYDMSKKTHLEDFYASSFFPFWVFPKTEKMERKLQIAFEKMSDLGVFKYPGGVPTSLINSGQQWDFPNSWPPLQYVAVHGLSRFEGEIGKTAELVAQNYIETAYKIWAKTGHMFEKYDVTTRDKAGHGGEYDVQEGFGWTNGVALNFLSKYGAKFTPRNSSNGADLVAISFMFAIVLAVIVQWLF